MLTGFIVVGLVVASVLIVAAVVFAARKDGVRGLVRDTSIAGCGVRRVCCGCPCGVAGHTLRISYRARVPHQSASDTGLMNQMYLRTREVTD